MYAIVRIAVSAAWFALLATDAHADTARPETDALKVVQQFSDDFSKQDMNAAIALCSGHPIIIDDFAPHVWQGPAACADWWNAFAADNARIGITDGLVTLGKPWHLTATGARAYAVLPLTFAYKLKGQSRTAQGVWTFALEKIAGRWRIAGMAFSLR